MNSFRLAPQADIDLDEIADYIAEHNPSAALREIERLYEKFRLLSANPLLGEARESLQRNLRAFVAGSYVIFYVPLSDGIEVERVIHGARDIESLF